MNISFIVSLWIHLTCAVLLVGGAFFFRVLLLKYAARHGGLTDELRETLAGRWLHVSGGFLLILLLTGLYQFTQKHDEWKEGEGPLKPDMIFGIKFLLFVAVCIVTAMAMASKGEKAKRRRTLLAINVVLGLLIVALSVVLANSY